MKDIREVFHIKRTNKKVESILIVILLCVVSSILTSLVYYFKFGSFLLSQNEQELIQTYNDIKKEYYENIDMDKVKEAAINGMVNFLGEDYSEVLTEENTDALADKLNGKYQGIGVTVVFDGKNTTIYEVMDDTPAKRAGVKEKDIISKIDGVTIDQSNYSKINEFVKGKDKIELELIRDNETITKTIEVKNIIKPCVKTSIIEENDKKIGYMYIEAFSSTADVQVKNSLKKLESDGIDSLIIDVRSNTGGYLEMADEIASMFIKKGKVLYQLKNKNKVTKVYDETKESRNYDVVVLINEASASASEILALSLKESYGAILVGKQSYGKGKVQQVSNLSNKDIVKLTVANWLSPNGNSIDGVGITPGISVDLTKEYAENPSTKTDNQLQKALEILTN